MTVAAETFSSLITALRGWTGQRHLEEWCRIAKSFDIETGYFEIGVLLALDGKWQLLDKIRIPMGYRRPIELERPCWPPSSTGPSRSGIASQDYQGNLS